MILSDTAVKNRTSVVVLILILVVVGLTSYFSLPRENFPDINIPPT